MRELYYYIYSHTRFAVLTLLIIVCFCGIFEWLADTVFADHKKLHCIWKLLILAELLFCMLLFLYASLFSRTASGEARYELELFWSYRRAIETQSPFWRRQILYNVLAFLPIGNALNYLMDNKRKWYYAVLVFAAVSVSVELIQLFFHLGLFEFDDIFDNLLGGILGYIIAECMRKMCKRNRNNRG